MKKVAFVSEGAVRTGRAVSLALAETGFDVVIQHHRTPAAALATARQVEAMGRRALVVESDLGQEEAVREAVRQAHVACGRLDVLVHCAGPVADSPEAGPETELLDAFRAPYLLTRMSAPLLVDSGGSVVHVVGSDAMDAAGASALTHFTRELARSLAPRVRVNAVTPERPPRAHGSGSPPATLHSGSRPGEVVRTVLFLLGASHLTGEVIRAGGDGGT